MKKLSKDNLIRVIVSLLFSMLLWVYAVSDSDPVTSQNYSAVTIQYVGQDVLEANQLMVQSQTSTVSITLYGRTQQLSKIKSSDLYAYADLSGITEDGSYTVALQISGVPDSVSITAISPEYVTVDIIPVYEKSLSYTLTYSGSASSGYAPTGYTSETEQVSVSGNEDAVDRISEISGEITLNGHNADFTQTVTLHAYASDGTLLNYVTISPSTVEATVTIDPTKTVDLKVVTSGNCPDGYYLNSVTPQQTQVTIAGDTATLKSITSVSTEAIVLTGQSASFTKNAAIATPSGTVVVGGNTVSVSVDIQPYHTVTYMYDTIQIRNIPAGLSCDLSSFTELTITLQGNAEAIDAVSKDDITVYIDLDGLSEGTHEVQIQYTLPNTNITVSSISMKKVSVTLE